MDRKKEFARRAAQLLGARGFTTDHELIEPFLTDWRGRFSGRALGMASPASTQEVSQIVQLCAEFAIPIVPQGGNSSMCGGATPDDSGDAIVLSLRRMNAVRRFDRVAMQVICEAGLILQNLHEFVEAEGLRFPLTLGGKGSATIGGLISTNAGGTQVLRHGTMRAQVLGIEAVMADGQIYNGLAALKKDNRGFDLKQLLIGSEGTLGIVTAANLRLLPAIGERIVIWCGLPSIRAARELLLMFEASLGENLEGFEVVPQHCLESVLEHLPNARSPLEDDHEWHALIELAATRKQVEQIREDAQILLADAMNSGILRDAAIASNETQAEQFWQLRDTIAPAERELGPAMQHDISVPVEKMPEFIERAIPRIESEFPGTKGIAFGHLGDGNVHFHILAPPDAKRGVWEENDGKLISHKVHDLVTEWGGSISAEHGIGQLKRVELARLSDPATLSIMRSVKQALDPQGILNPGKLVVLAPEASTP